MLKRTLAFITAFIIAAALFPAVFVSAADTVVCVDFAAGYKSAEAGLEMYKFNGENHTDRIGDIRGLDLVYTCAHGWFGSSVCGSYVFGYRVNGGEPVVSDEFTRTYEEAVYNAVANNVGDVAFVGRYSILAPVVKGGNIKVEYLAVPADESCDIIVLCEQTYENPSDTISDTAYGISFNGKSSSATVKNAVAVGEGRVYFEAPVTFELDAKDGGEFNCFTIEYSCEDVLIGEVYILQGDTIKTEKIFLEPSESGKLTQLISDYTEGKTAAELRKIIISTTKPSSEFTLKAISASLRETLDMELVTLENDKAKVKINVRGGGGIAYFEDKNDNDENTSNLLIGAGSEYFVQQEYYTADGSYWPAQCGDLNGNGGVLADFVIGENSIYVKTIPLNRSASGEVTDCYMETVYTLEGNCLKVVNRCRDFSDNDKRTVETEKPAVYTLPGLDTFTYFRGQNSWAEAKLRTTTELGTDYEGGRFKTNADNLGNTETWGALTSSETGRGIGVFLPGAEYIRVARLTEGSGLASESGGMNILAPLADIAVSGSTLEYTYLLAVGSVEEIRAAFTEGRDDMNTDIIIPEAADIKNGDSESSDDPAEATPEAPAETETPVIIEGNSGGSWPLAVGILVIFVGGTAAIAILTVKKEEKSR